MRLSAGLCLAALTAGCVSHEPAPSAAPSALAAAPAPAEAATSRLEPAAAATYNPPMPPDYWQWMQQISNEYRADNNLVADIKDCYFRNGSGKIAWLYKYQGLRTCLYLDYTGYQDNQVATMNYKTPGNPFFSRRAARSRWRLFGPKAGYASRAEMLRSMRNAYRLIKPLSVNAVPAYSSSISRPAPAKGQVGGR